jgi:hypothetical protein
MRHRGRLAFSAVIITLAWLTVCPSALVAAPPPVGPAALERRLEMQRLVREQAQLLVVQVLDVQLQNLEENKLQDHPLYREIRGMRGNLSALVDGEMHTVLELLAKSHDGPSGDREQSLAAARRLTRDIVARLAAERQRLRRRLKTVSIGSQVQKLIDTQSRVSKATQALPEQSESQREEATLAVIEDQRDVRQLYLQLAATLEEVSRWGDEVGASATEALRSLESAAVAADLERAESALEKLRPADAVQSQQQAMKSLQSVLQDLAPSSGSSPPGLADDRAAAERLLDRQKELRAQTAGADLTASEADRLIDAQSEIRKELERLAEGASSNPAAREPLEQAAAAAKQATSRLFDSNRDAALAAQDDVLKNIGRSMEQAKRSNDREQPEQSASDLAAATRDLEAARDAMQRIARQQAQVDRDAGTAPDKAVQTEQSVAADLGHVGDEDHLPPSVARSLSEARDAAADAARQLPKSPEGGDRTGAQRSLRRADHAIERAASEIDAALADARRRTEGVNAGELARAAEAVERAAAVQRQIAEMARQAARGAGLDPDAAGELRRSEDQLRQTTESAARAVRQNAPEAAAALQEALDAAKQAGQQFAEAERETGAPSPDTAAEGAKAADAAQEKLTDAARELRNEVAASADRLAAESARQEAQARSAREAAEQTLEDAGTAASESIDRLAGAGKKIQSALADQQRAAGRPQAAEAMELAQAVHEAMNQQQAAAGAAGQYEQGDGTSRREAIAAQQAVADTAAKAASAAREQAERNTGRRDQKSAAAAAQLANSLGQAARSAERAAQAQLEGRSADAAAERKAATEALQQAEAQAGAAADLAASVPAGPPDRAAQERVGKGAAEAAALAAQEVPTAGKNLNEAEKLSGQATDALRAGQTDRAAATQRETADALRRAREQIQSALGGLRDRQAGQMDAMAAKTGELTKDAAAIDPAALAALRNAQSQAQQSEAEPEARNAAQKKARDELQRAAASLAAREQQIRKDHAAAEEIADAARRQQGAADRIAAARKALEEDPGTDPPAEDSSKRTPPAQAANGNGKPPDGAIPPPEEADESERKQNAARDLLQARDEFADTQRAVGERAEEIAGQSQVANPDLRDALDRASQFPPQGRMAGTGVQGKAAVASQKSGKGGKAPSSGKKNGEGGEGSPADSPAAAGGGKSPAGDSALGSGFVPNSPDATASMLAGPEALARAGGAAPADSSSEIGSGPAESSPNAGSAQGAGAEPPGQGADGQAGPGDASDGQSATTAGTGGTGQGARSPTGNKSGSASGGDAVPPTRPRGEEPWLIRLPPEMRKAIRARAQRPAPRGYEERLKRYFEGID